MERNSFTSFNGVSRNRLVRLNPDGSVDYTINFGRGANDYVNSVGIQTDRKIVIGGGFTEFDGQPRNYIARLNGGDNYGSGEFAFSAATYSVLRRNEQPGTTRPFLDSACPSPDAENACPTAHAPQPLYIPTDQVSNMSDPGAAGILPFERRAMLSRSAVTSLVKP